MKILENILNLFTPTSHNSIYNCPIYNFFMAVKNDNPNYLYADESKHDREKFTKRISNRYSNIYFQYIDEMGLGDRFMDYLRAKNNYHKSLIKFISTEKKIHLNDIEKYKNEYIRIEENQKQDVFDIYEIVEVIEKHRGMKIDIKAVTVKEYCTYYKKYQSDAKKN